MLASLGGIEKEEKRLGLHLVWVSWDIFDGLQSFPCIVQLLLGVQILEWLPEILLPSTCCLAWHPAKKSYNVQYQKYVDGREARFKIYRASYNFLVHGKRFF